MLRKQSYRVRGFTLLEYTVYCQQVVDTCQAVTMERDHCSSQASTCFALGPFTLCLSQHVFVQIGEIRFVPSPSPTQATLEESIQVNMSLLPENVYQSDTTRRVKRAQYEQKW